MKIRFKLYFSLIFILVLDFLNVRNVLILFAFQCVLAPVSAPSFKSHHIKDTIATTTKLINVIHIFFGLVYASSAWFKATPVFQKNHFQSRKGKLIFRIFIFLFFIMYYHFTTISHNPSTRITIYISFDAHIALAARFSNVIK